MVLRALALTALFRALGMPIAGGRFEGLGMSGFKQSLTAVAGGMYANGGRPPLGKVSLVGERGPELFVPDSAGTVIPNHALGGGGTVIPDVRISGDDLLIVFDNLDRLNSDKVKSLWSSIHTFFAEDYKPFKKLIGKKFTCFKITK